MKTAVYAIALNEEEFAERFMLRCGEADLVLVGDTGSSDRTRQILRDFGAQVVDLRVKPWRYDVPRNALLSLLPEDVDLCVKLDFDEILPANWREPLERDFVPGKHHRVEFRYVHSYKPDGSYATVGFKTFFHARYHYIWRHAVHEMLYFVGDGEEKICTVGDLVVEHRQIPRARRQGYLALLELECRDAGTTPRHLFWLGREYVLHARWQDACDTLRQFLNLADTWRVERSTAMGLLANATCRLGRDQEALGWYERSCAEAPNEREPWIDLARFHFRRKQWRRAYRSIMRALSLSRRPEHYLVRRDSWNEEPYDLAAKCAFEIGMIDDAKEHLRRAIEVSGRTESLADKAARIGVSI